MHLYTKIFLKKENISAPDILLLNIVKYMGLPISYSAFSFQIQKGKVHGSIDVGLSVMSIKKKARRIDLDTEEHIYHLKVKVMQICILFSSTVEIRNSN